MEENKIPVEEASAQELEIMVDEENKSNETVEDVETPPKEEKNCKSDKKKLKKLEAELAELKQTLVQKDADCAELNEKHLRLAAEYENFRKRSTKEQEGKYADACCDVLTQILPVLDNLERAAQYNTEDSAETPMGKGLELTLKSFSEILSKLGVAEIEALGKSFDPNLHNAVMHIEDENFGENEIVEVFMKGYIKGDKVLRYSMVKVAN